MPWIAALALVAGVALGWIVAGLRSASRLSDASSAAARAEAERDALRERIREQELEVDELHERVEKEQQLRVVAETRAADVASMQKLVSDTREQLEAAYAKLSQRALSTAIENLEQRVGSRLDKTETTISHDLGQRKSEIELMLQPVREMLDSYREEVRRAEKTRSEAYGSIDSQIKGLLAAHQDLLSETGRLSAALTAPGTGGNWGENSLRRCVEIAGMSEYCDFDLQMTVTDAGGGSLRPDMIVRLPDDRVIAVDSKISAKFYMDAASATEESERKRHLQSHARAVRRHVDGLAKKEYAKQIESALDKSLDFTILFMGNESFLSTALTHDAALWDYATSRKVFLASPTILVPLLQALATGWKAEKIEENAERALEAAVGLYDRFCIFADHLQKVGSGLDQAVGSWNAAVGSFESRLEVQARRLQELTGSGKTSASLGRVEKLRRESPKLSAIAEEEDGVDAGREN